MLEDVKPVPRRLIYLKPRQENQWLLSFNEAVTYALEREVFEDNFRCNDRVAPDREPLRTSYILIYLQGSMFDSILR
jgi:hypothetical protein